MRGYGATLVVLLVACGGESGGKKTGIERFSEIINVDIPVDADLFGFEPGADLDEITWLTQDIDPSLQGGDFTIDGIVEDFESGDGVDKALVELWYDNLIAPTADVQSESDDAGDVSIDGPSCEPMTYRVTTDPLLGETKTTYKAHQIYPHPGVDAESIDSAYFLSVSSMTYLLIPTILGVVVDEDKAIIAGTAFDVTRDPAASTDDDSGKIEGAQIIVYDENGDIPDSLIVNYFIEDFPDRDQLWTSADGLWVASNVPPGNLTVEMWGQVDGELKILGASQITSEPSSINITNVFAGYADGVKYPSSCEL